MISSIGRLFSYGSPSCEKAIQLLEATWKDRNVTTSDEVIDALREVKEKVTTGTFDSVEKTKVQQVSDYYQLCTRLADPEMTKSEMLKKLREK